MEHKVIKLSEIDLHKIVKESVIKILSEEIEDIGIDITKIPLQDLIKGYKDLSLAPVSNMYGHPLYEPVSLKEAVGDTYPPEEAIKMILQKYNLPETFGVQKEHFHNIRIYILIADIGNNEKLITEDMSKLGYFLSKVVQEVEIKGMGYHTLQFEPMSQLQEDITDKLKKKYNKLYHWTPAYNVKDIMKNGLVPNHGNDMFNYPSRTYLMVEDSDERKMYSMGQNLCINNKSSQNNGEYALLSVDITGLDEGVRFYYDPNSAIGIYTEQEIPSKKIQLVKTIQFVKSLK